MSEKSWAASPLHDVNQIDQILLTLEDSAPVSLIATFKMATCNSEDQAKTVLNQAELKDFDYIPVVSSESVVGVISRNDIQKPEGTVQQNMQPLHESILISADSSLLSFVAEVDVSPVRLVLKGRKIAGIVTISDIQKLAARPLLFMLITSVELLLAEWLRRNYPDDQIWLSRLSESRQEKINSKWKNLLENNLAVDRITTTDFCDKRDAYLKLNKFPPGDKKPTERGLKAIENLRDSIAHAGDYALTPKKAETVAETVRQAKEIIQTLQKELHLLSISRVSNSDLK